MSFRVESGESLAPAITRIVSEEMESAACQLTDANRTQRDKAIHEARKSIKKVRGVLRLLDPQLNGTSRGESVRLRNAGRKLSRFRDAGVIIETFDELLEKHQGDLEKRGLNSIRRVLLKRKNAAERRAHIQQVLDTTAASLRKTGDRIGKWPLPVDGLPSLEPALEAAYRRSQEAMAKVRKDPRTANYHEWRKRAKDHWYQVRLLESHWTAPMRDYEKRLKQLEAHLGDEHNLVVLRETVQAHPSLYGTEQDIRLFLKVLKKYQKELRAAALEAGAHIYKDKPKHYVQHVRKMWEAPTASS
jgi:CHAD domain-containing protein